MSPLIYRKDINSQIAWRMWWNHFTSLFKISVGCKCWPFQKRSSQNFFKTKHTLLDYKRTSWKRRVAVMFCKIIQKSENKTAEKENSYTSYKEWEALNPLSRMRCFLSVSKLIHINGYILLFKSSSRKLKFPEVWGHLNIKSAYCSCLYVIWNEYHMHFWRGEEI